LPADLLAHLQRVEVELQTIVANASQISARHGYPDSTAGSCQVLLAPEHCHHHHDDQAHQ
jgi:hypothetical protein